MAVAASTANRIHAQDILIAAGTVLTPEPDRRPEDAWETDADSRDGVDR